MGERIIAPDLRLWARGGRDNAPIELSAFIYTQINET